MTPVAVALQFPSSDLANAEWDAEEIELVAATVADHKARRLEALQHGLRIGQPNGAPTDLATLKAEVAMVVAGGRGAGPAWPTGVARLDAALGGGVPRGRVTEVVGPLGAGKTSLVRGLAARVLGDGGWVAWVDATRTLAPQELAGMGERLIVVRPRDNGRGAWCADLLLRSGVFALVVLDGAPVLSRTVGVRLSQLARERDAAFVVLREGTQGSRLGGAVRLQVRPGTVTPFMQARPPWLQRRRVEERSYSVLVEKGGSYQTVEVTCAIVMARRVCADTEIPDRRGVARRTRAATGTGAEHALQSQPATGESVRAHESVATSARNGQTTAAAPLGQPGNDAVWKGRGRARMAESHYGRARRTAREFVNARQHAEPDGPAPRKSRAAEQEQLRHERRESRQQSRHELHKLSSTLG